MALLSLLLAVGAAMVWGPISIYLLATGKVAHGLGLMAWGTVVIGPVVAALFIAAWDLSATESEKHGG